MIIQVYSINNKTLGEGEDSKKEFTMDDARNKIRIVFKYYASFGDRLNMTYIQASKVVKMVKESGMLDKGVTK